MVTRIGSACWFRVSDKQEWRAGTLHFWGQDFEEFDDGPAPVPIGVIEDVKTGMCLSVHVSRICFAASPPADD